MARWHLLTLATVVPLLVRCSSSESATPGGDAGLNDASTTDTSTTSDAGADALRSEAFVDSLVGPKKRVMWIAPHPDDEYLTGAVLGELGAERGVDLTFLLATRGEATSLCNRPQGCGTVEADGALPDIAGIRDGEMQAAADFYGGKPTKVVNLKLPDGSNGFESFRDPRVVIQNWAAVVGGGVDGLIDKFATEIKNADPDVILDQDPRHGTTCHPDHRATAWLVMMAVKKAGLSIPIYAEESIGTIDSNGKWGNTSAVPGDTNDIVVDESPWAPKLAKQLWIYVPLGASKHSSQLPSSLVDHLMDSTPALEKSHFLRMNDFAADPRYDLCGVVFGHSADDLNGASDAGDGGG